ncbi:protein mono-ADP-ribosyltransferase PARP12-like isoform X2 [Archocentrus centrarchus]|uniref:protein mono-ADP-ribosyltransferase PARP12-like isoform X2 n=1 Tax=Archocentrus centrarchus TaxID=63155 RepID=UPI0011EA05AF|nr:protein mono-ADP-ribosyltransferase PARP12-like isoform X2 [Archocentrus centrarchus]
METEILKIICASQGAIDTDDLLYNLFSDDPSMVSEIICNREKFVSCCPNGQPKVVARTRLRLCRVKDCPQTCRALHLCKNFLFSGVCQFTQHRRGCRFSHELNSDHNQRLLREHELESLSREELCTLLLQNDNGLLPDICHDYNNGDGEFGKCNDGYGCKRLHICEQYVSRECSCWRNHDFNALQPLKTLQEKSIPGTLFQFLKPVYANKEALRLAAVNERGQQRQRGRGRGRGGNQGGRGGNQGGRGGNQGNRGGRGTRGSRGIRGNRGNQICHPLEYRASSFSVFFDNLSLYTSDGLNEDSGKNSPSSDISAATSDNDATSENGETKKRTRRSKKASATVRERGENRGNHQPLQKTRSSSDIHAAVDEEAVKGQNNRQRPIRDKTDICMYFIKGHCKHEDRCFKAHDKMPYRWQVQQGGQWTALPDNETIERDYCDPSKSYSSTSPAVHFETMTCGSDKVRRLSTENSVIEPTYIHTTEWLWYWEDEFGEWNMYSSDTGGHKSADINSTKLEEKFLVNDKDVVEFTAGSQSYSLSFQDMIQTNKRYSTKKLVRRRPRFVSAADVLTKKVRRPLVQTSAPIPDNWDKTHIPETGYKPVSLQRSSGEFKEVEALFCKTMRGFDMVSIERIQNKALWEVFQWQKNQMKSKNGGRNVTEKKLFHGTDSKFVDTICHHNFDWRICGTHGTAFGKGSYFARDARYSHNYTGDTDVRTMFISRVLVGNYTRGSSDYVRPPSKDGGDINFYDSCVDDVMNPSIFVVFEKHQIYPEYLLQYKTTYSGGAAPAPKPVAAPKPVVATKPAATLSASQPSTVSSQYRTSTSSSLHSPSTASSISRSNTTSSGYQPSTASSGYQTSSSSSVHSPSTASSVSRSNTTSLGYQPSTASSGYQSSTAYSGYQTSTSSSLHSPSRASSISRSNTTSLGYQSSMASSGYQASTSSYLYSPSAASSFSQSTGYPPSRTFNQSKPVPPPKKPDPCVIF